MRWELLHVDMVTLLLTSEFDLEVSEIGGGIKDLNVCLVGDVFMAVERLRKDPGRVHWISKITAGRVAFSRLVEEGQLFVQGVENGDLLGFMFAGDLNDCQMDRDILNVDISPDDSLNRIALQSCNCLLGMDI